MCGIVGFCGRVDALPLLLDGLSRLEYRGYDSAGIAVVGSDIIKTVKTKGRIENLKKEVEDGINGTLGIGHTRWATHGVPNETNSHPHLSKSGTFAVVHNGIIENFAEIKEFLLERGFVFKSDTDTEVIAHLLDYYYNGDAVRAIIKTAQRLLGSYALAILCMDCKDTLFAMRKESPLVIGVGFKDGMLAASDMTALLPQTRDFIFPDNGEIALIKADSVRIINFNEEEIQKKIIHADWQEDAAKKNGFEHFMLKEIYEQPRAIADTLKGLKTRLDDYSSLKNINNLIFIGCGSAYHAGLGGKYFIEKLTRIPCLSEMASEFRYKNPIIKKGTLAIAISQSGETADTIAALTLAKKNAKTLPIVNVLGSSVARMSNEVIYTLAGPEIAVATTKGYVSQVAALNYLGLYLCKKRVLENKPCGLKLFPPSFFGESFLTQNKQLYFFDDTKSRLKLLDLLEEELNKLPLQIIDLLNQKEIFQQLSSRFSFVSYAFFIGRGIDYAIAMEGALKLKEISYIHAECYAAGELKHGTISLIEEDSLVIAIATDPALSEKIINNIHEVKSRGAVVLAVTCFDEVAAVCNYSIKIKEGINSPVLASVALQMFAYYVALNRGCDIDKPRNLAKSVTVE